MEKIISSYLQDKAFEIVEMPGDAGARKYYKVIFNTQGSLICCVYEELNDSFHNFTYLTDLLTKGGVKTPRILNRNGKVMLLEDLGDNSLQDYYKKSPLKGKQLYSKTIRELLKIQAIKTDLSFKTSEKAFTDEKFMWEMNFSLDHLSTLFNFKQYSKDEFFSEFSIIAKELTSSTQTLTHRDFHSRNIMVKDDSCFIIDFQDARFGPFVYDIVSLVEDTYVNFDQKYKDDLIDQFCSLSGIKNNVEFKRIYNTQAIQRTLKACGSFARLKNLKNNSRYLQYLKPSLINLKGYLKNDDSFKKVLELTEASLKEVELLCL